MCTLKKGDKMFMRKQTNDCILMREENSFYSFSLVNKLFHKISAHVRSNPFTDIPES